MAAYKYVTLGAQERLAIATDWLRGRESDLYRATLQAPDPDTDAGVAALRESADRASKEVTAVDKEAKAEAKKDEAATE